MTAKRTIFIMVDGLGMPSSGWKKSFFDDMSTDFCRLLDENSSRCRTDMGVQGLPQSATGQTSLFTGVKTAASIGSHLPGFPGPRMREIILQNNIFKYLLEKGFSVAFANAYLKYNLDELRNMSLRSVTTVMVESAIGWVRGLECLLSGKAVYHDITNETASSKYGKVPAISPEKAAQNLLSISESHDFTLFEYFLTDRDGHKMDMKALKRHFSDLGRMVVEIAKGIGSSTSLILTSDHGNAEDMSIRTHTRNPVPLMLLNTGIGSLQETRIEDVFSITTRNFNNA